MRPRSTPLPGRGRVLRALAALVGLATATTGVVGCASGSVASPPAGVDGLVIPTPSAEPGDFVAAVTNPWFPLRPGARMVYDAIDARGSHRLTVTVRRGPDVAGVATTARVARQGGRATTDWYAQDRSGNVWWFGRAGEWRAGADGAEAGLAVPAVPRVGDGWATAYADGADVQVATVVALNAALAVPEGDHYPVLLIDVVSPATGEDRDVYYAKGAGLLQENTQHGPYRVVQLVRLVPPAGP
jgi:hypothetical protein